MITIYWAGDSTVQYNDIRTFPQTGIGQAIPLYLKPEIAVKNYAKNGRSTKSFLDEGRFAPIETAIGKGDFLFIQFGHNDEKIQDPKRYTTPDGTFRENLLYMAETARKVGAYPVLITALERREFDENGKLLPSRHTDYVNAMKQLGQDEQIPVIDLWQMSRAMIEKAGTEETKKWFNYVQPGLYPHFPDGKEDNTHLQYGGAVAFAGCIAQGLKELGGIYADLLIGDAPIEE